jgi:polysaccharide biosynthesis/export protein
MSVEFSVLRSCAIHAHMMIAVSALFLSVVPARAEYRLAAGDALEISVAGIADLKQRVPVQADGSISFPLLGTISVEGLSPSEARARIQTGLAAKLFRQRGPDGRDSVIIIEPDQVTATVVGFRPVFVDGDVSKPGEQSYRAGMTVREAVALSGGYDTMHLHMEGNPFLISADLRSEYESQWTDFVKEQAGIWRVQNELGREAKFDSKLLTDVPIGRSTIAHILELESEQLTVHQSDYEQEKKFLQKVIAQNGDHIKVVSEELQKDEDGLAADEQDLRRLSELFTKGAVPMPRVTDARRALLLTSTRKLQTASQLMKLQETGLELDRRRERLDAQRKTDLLRELQERNVRLAQIRSRLQSIEDKLQYTGLIKSQLIRGATEKPKIIVVRKGNGGRQQMDADEDFELQPGDVVQVALHQTLPRASADADGARPGRVAESGADQEERGTQERRPSR